MKVRGERIALAESAKAILFAQLQLLRSDKERLWHLFRQLRHQPELGGLFLQELEEMRRRAERLDVMLTPFPGSPTASGICCPQSTTSKESLCGT